MDTAAAATAVTVTEPGIHTLIEALAFAPFNAAAPKRTETGEISCEMKGWAPRIDIPATISAPGPPDKNHRSPNDAAYVTSGGEEKKAKNEVDGGMLAPSVGANDGYDDVNHRKRQGRIVHQSPTQRQRSNDHSKNIDSAPTSSSIPRSRKCVQFVCHVNLRCFFDSVSQMQPWLDKVELQENRSRLKQLIRLHSKTNASNGPPIGDVVRYEIMGESLRGMERMTDTTNGRYRARLKGVAIRVVMIEQRRQLIRRVVDSSALDEARRRAAKIDAVKLARAYGSVAQGALVYARLVAEEDAKVAAAILAEDLH